MGAYSTSKAVIKIQMFGSFNISFFYGFKNRYRMQIKGTGTDAFGTSNTVRSFFNKFILALREKNMLVVHFTNGVSAVGTDIPIIAPPNTTFRMSFGFTL
jgi:hypothetical protein